jgi:hypothetical protein
MKMRNTGNLKIVQLLAVVIVISATSCMPKSFFTSEIRSKLEADTIQLNKLQFYVDRDVELRREVSSADMKVTSGQIKYVSGKYVQIIMLKKFTPGVCSKVNKNSLEINFEVGDGKTLTFGVTGVSTPGEIYRLFANRWISQDAGKIGEIKYDNQTYYIQPNGEGARLMIKKSVIANLKVDTKTMGGVKVQ